MTHVNIHRRDADAVLDIVHDETPILHKKKKWGWADWCLFAFGVMMILRLAMMV